MATSHPTIDEEIAAGLVPVREGVYGDKVVAVEPGGVEFIPDRERHGRPLDLFWTWLSPNMEFATIFVGSLAVFLFGNSFWAAALAVTLGSALGSITHGVLSSWGPRFGAPQLVISRGAFGFVGNVLPALLQTFTSSIGWFIVNSVSGAFALMTLFNWGNSLFWLAFTIVVVAQIAVAFFGYNLVHTFERYLFPYLGVVFGIAVVIIFTKANYSTGFNTKAPLAFGGPMGSFILATAAAFGYAAGWNPYAADYTRYLPNRPEVARQAGFWAGLGVFLSCTVLEIAGAAVVTVAGTKWGPTDIPTAQFTSALPGLLATLVLIGIVAGAVAANAINVYSGAMAFLTLGINLPLRLRRAIVAIGAGVVGLLIGILFQANVGPGSSYENFLLIIAYWIGPWLGVVFADYLIRRGDYDEAALYSRSYSAWAGVISMLIGIAATYFFWDQGPPLSPGKLPGLGAVPLAAPQLGDLSFLVGFAVAFVAQSALGRVLPRSRPAAELAA